MPFHSLYDEHPANRPHPLPDDHSGIQLRRHNQPSPTRIDCSTPGTLSSSHGTPHAMEKCRASPTFTIATCVSTASDQSRRYNPHLQTRPQRRDTNQSSGHYSGMLRRGTDGVTAVYLEARFYLYGRNFGGSETPPKPQTPLTASFGNYQSINHPKAGGSLLASLP